MDTCKGCENAIFDETWGEYKCKVNEHRVHAVDSHVVCPDRKPKSKKTEEEYFGDMA